jgi:hypothetical protein
MLELTGLVGADEAAPRAATGVPGRAHLAEIAIRLELSPVTYKRPPSATEWPTAAAAATFRSRCGPQRPS